MKPEQIRQLLQMSNDEQMRYVVDHGMVPDLATAQAMREKSKVISGHAQAAVKAFTDGDEEAVNTQIRSILDVASDRGLFAACAMWAGRVLLLTARGVDPNARLAVVNAATGERVNPDEVAADNPDAFGAIAAMRFTAAVANSDIDMASALFNTVTDPRAQGSFLFTLLRTAADIDGQLAAERMEAAGE